MVRYAEIAPTTEWGAPVIHEEVEIKVEKWDDSDAPSVIDESGRMVKEPEKVPDTVRMDLLAGLVTGMLTGSNVSLLTETCGTGTNTISVSGIDDKFRAERERCAMAAVSVDVSRCLDPGAVRTKIVEAIRALK